MKGRLQFVVECIESVKERVGSDFPLIVGMVSDHKIAGGNTVEDTIRMAKHFEEVGIHALYLRVGGYDAPAWLVPPLYMKDGCGVPSAQPIREAIKIPVIVDGKIRTPKLAEKILERGEASFVSIARPMLADPEWPKKAREGRLEEIRECIACNECIARLRNWAPLGCSVNAALGREEDCDIVPTSKSKKVLVIGGGPAGMEAARVAAQRGHDVSLFEKDDKLGGHLIEASAPPFKKDLDSLLRWLTGQLETLKVEIALGTKVTVETVHRLKPDAVICATGSILEVPDARGVKSSIVTSAIDVLRKKATVGQKVVIVGGNQIGCETAAYLAQMGKTVTIVRRGMEAGPFDTSPVNVVPLMNVLAENKVCWMTNMDVKEIGADGIVLIDRKEGREQTLRADAVVIAKGLVADNRLYNDLEGKVPELYVIGDSVKPRKIWEAIREGFSIAREI